MEIFLAAYLSKDRNMLKAINKGYDMHSYSAYLIFKDKWINAGESAEPKSKPKSKEGGKMRKTIKTLTFGLLYGSGVVTFSENANIPLSEAKILKKEYFDTFPELASFFQKSGEYALTHLYIREPFFNRVRFFNRPKNGAETSHVKNAAMNYRPQASNGSIIKYALCLMKKYIEDNNLDNKVKLILSVYDQNTTMVLSSFAKEWAIIQTAIMEKAAKHAVPEGTIKAETDILDHWTK